MAPKKNKKNGAAEAAYEYKLKVGDPIRYIRDSQNYGVGTDYDGKLGTVQACRFGEDGLPELDALFGTVPLTVHPDDCALVVSEGNERTLEPTADEPLPQQNAMPSEPFPMGVVSRDCPVPLAPEVFATKAQRLAHIPLDIKALEDKLATQKQLTKDLVSGLEGEQSVLAGEVRDNAEMKPVPCEWIGDPKHGRKYLKRQDTGAIVEEATLSAAECQEAFGFDDDEPGSDEPEPVLTGSDDGESASASAH